MNFDSHIGRLLTTAVRLVNATTPGADGGHAVATPTGPRLIAAVAAAIESSPTAADAEHLADVTRDVRLVFEAADRGDVDDRGPPRQRAARAHRRAAAAGSLR